VSDVYASRNFPLIKDLHTKYRRAIIRKYFIDADELGMEDGRLFSKAHIFFSLLLCILFLVAFSPTSEGKLIYDNFVFEAEFPYSPNDNEVGGADNFDNTSFGGNNIPYITDGASSGSTVNNATGGGGGGSTVNNPTGGGMGGASGQGHAGNNLPTIIGRDNLRDNSPTIIEGEIVDSGTGAPISGARVGGEVHSGIIYVNTQADANGHFRIVLPTGENHTYVLNISAVGYDSQTITGSVRSGERKYLHVSINYNPFDLQLSETSGNLTHPYTSHSYSGMYSVPFTAQRTVPVTDARGNPVYDTVEEKAFTGYTWEEKVTRYNTVTVLLSANGGEWVDTGETFIEGWFNPKPALPAGYRWVEVSRGYTLGIWTTTTFKKQYNAVEYYQGQGYSVTGYTATKQVPYEVWETRSSTTRPSFLNPILGTISSDYSDRIRNLKEVYTITTKLVPRTRVETYTAYRVYDYSGTSYSYLPWDEKRTTVTATPRNGYTGNVRLEVVAGDGVDASVDSSVLSFSSPASTVLHMRPMHASTHTVTVKAYDSNWRLVRIKTYTLNTTESIPSGSYWERYVGTVTRPDVVPATITSTSTSTVDVEVPESTSWFRIYSWDDRRSDVPFDSPLGQWLMSNVYSGGSSGGVPSNSVPEDILTAQRDWDQQHFGYWQF
jgi:hypothetical protein